MAQFFLGLGSNLGDRRAHINAACVMLKKEGIKPIAMSDVLETDPVGGPAQGKYLNAVVCCESMHEPLELYSVIKKIEKHLGRIKSVLNGPRVIDIDILFYDDLKLVTKKLVIPHPRATLRSFVLKPLSQLDPHLCASLRQS